MDGLSMSAPDLTWMLPGDPFPSLSRTWGPTSDAPGLLAAGGALDVETLRDAYARGIFPWFNESQPTLWWSPDPRMVLATAEFKLHDSLRKTLRRFQNDAHCEIRMNSNFAHVIRQCAQAPRQGQNGTWIVPAMVDAYIDFHHAGYAHSVETWIDGAMVAGLYFVAMGRAVYGESMFTQVRDGSKIALAALVAHCRANEVPQLDCQQVTAHLSRLGARPVQRAQFLATMQAARAQTPVDWVFSADNWKFLQPAH